MIRSIKVRHGEDAEITFCIDQESWSRIERTAAAISPHISPLDYIAGELNRVLDENDPDAGR